LRSSECTPGSIPLRECYGRDTACIGGKASNLSRLVYHGFKVPPGICLTGPVYDDFISRTGIKDRIFFELGRKALVDMRWEEMWDTSLRIRSFFLKARMPDDIRGIVRGAVKEISPGAFAVRSSSVFEDSRINSFAGLHESFLNVRGEGAVMEHVKLVWASLWSDSAIAYSRELGLDPRKVSMPVIVQRMVDGECSGVAFGASPVDRSSAVIEVVPGLNKGLVDGDVEPDRWTVKRETGVVSGHVQAEERRKTIVSGDGIRMVPAGDDSGELFGEKDALRLFHILEDVERRMSYVPDMEWTVRDGDVYLLQVRPVSGTRYNDTDRRRGWDMTLRRSFDNLKKLSGRITGELIPGMVREAGEMAETDLETLDDRQLAEEVSRRKGVCDKWKDIYRDEFIPFAHGVRLFGQIYNDRMKPEDPYEFVDLISGYETESVRRNRIMMGLARKLEKEYPGFLNGEAVDDPGLKGEVRELMDDFPGVTGEHVEESEKERIMLSILRKLARRTGPGRTGKTVGRERRRRAFLDTFSASDRGLGEELLELASLSYRLRDDDNIYLARLEAELRRAVSVSRGRLGAVCEDTRACEAAGEVVMALRIPGYKPRSREGEEALTGTRSRGRGRQMRGQPAGSGIARGPAAVIRTRDDLLDVKEGDVIVCDSIDPEMTFIIPVAAGIIERRGGMLIHGAIIAREYGIPCVTGIPEATARIGAGDDLTIDGYSGIVIDHSVGTTH
jgi:pyruvate,water dikinase